MPVDEKTLARKGTSSRREFVVGWLAGLVGSSVNGEAALTVQCTARGERVGEGDVDLGRLKWDGCFTHQEDYDAYQVSQRVACAIQQE